jgi:signal transduction histidine kinase
LYKTEFLAPGQGSAAASAQARAEANVPVFKASAHRRSSWMRPLARIGRAGDGYDSEVELAMLENVDRLRPFASALLAIRWGTAMVSLALAGNAFVDANWGVVGWCGVLLAYTVIRTVSPIRYVGDLKSLAIVLFEVTLLVAALAATDGWSSPFVFMLAASIIVAGFARGFGFAIRTAIAAIAATTIPFLMRREATEADLRLVLQWSVILILVALIAGYTRRISGEADRQRSLALDRLTRLSDANALLFSLHRVAQTLPASLDMNEVLDTTIARLRGLLEFHSIAILLFDDTDAHWQVLRREGMVLPQRLGATELPRQLTQALANNQLVEIQDLTSAQVPGMTANSGCGVYTVLPARGSVIGLLAIEHRSPNHYSRRDIEMLHGFVEPVALAIDNARWFGRLRTVGADEERTRIARDLHDRIGQSLAYLAFELDRIVSTDERGEPVSSSLSNLRNDVRGVIREVRDTLYDLRTDVSESMDILATLEAFANRLQERSDLQVTILADNHARLPLLQEREVWRIAQEALVNVERHAGARRAEIRWHCSGQSAVLEIVDDGKGFPIGKAGRIDSYGIMGMRERASSIGASFDIMSEPGRGTLVRCVVAAAP